MAKQCINPTELFDSLQYGFSQVVTTRGSRTVYLSGQVGWDAEQQIVDPHDLAAQTRQALRNIETGLRSSGAGLEDIVSMRIYIVISELKRTSAIRDALLDFFPVDPPATTWIGVQGLADPEFLVEIEPVAILDD